MFNITVILLICDMDTLGRVSSILLKGDNFCDFLFALPHTMTLLESGLPCKERICPSPPPRVCVVVGGWGVANSSLLVLKVLTAFQKGTNNHFQWVTSLESISDSLIFPWTCNFCLNFTTYICIKAIHCITQFSLEIPKRQMANSADPSGVWSGSPLFANGLAIFL